MLNERRLQITHRFDYISTDGTEMNFPAYSWVDVLDLCGETLVRVAFGDYRILTVGYHEDDLAELLNANPHLTRSDLM